jgi:hypothetical protein
MTHKNYSQKQISVKAFTEEEESDPEHCDEYEESLGDSTENKGRQSIADMVTKHKLHMTKNINKKMIS